MTETEVAIVGAGPYGLAMAAHLRGRGVPFRIFGEPMGSWLKMPKGMFLKSLGFATSISCPEPDTDFPTWLESRGMESFEPVTTQAFAEYGQWIQQKVAPHLENVMVESVAQDGDGFALKLANGNDVRAKRVVVAVGLGPLQRLPKQLEGLPKELASHSFGHHEYSAYAGKDLAVVGAGASAIEAATLAHEQGVRVKLLVRGNEPIIHTQMKRERTLRERWQAPMSQLGPSRKSWLVEQLGGAMRYVPDQRRVNFARHYLGPSGSWWLRDRFVGKVPVLAHTSIVSARAVDGKVALRLAEQGKPEREELFEHVVCGTGFEHDLDRLPMLAPALRQRLERVEKAPRLSRHFESSLRGLYFVGPISAYSFGPFFRFVCGTDYTAKKAARHIAAQGGLVASLLRRVAMPQAAAKP